MTTPIRTTRQAVWFWMASTLTQSMSLDGFNTYPIHEFGWLQSLSLDGLPIREGGWLQHLTHPWWWMASIREAWWWSFWSNPWVWMASMLNPSMCLDGFNPWVWMAYPSMRQDGFNTSPIHEDGWLQSVRLDGGHFDQIREFGWLLNWLFFMLLFSSLYY
jgi:hypothetical protein